MRKPPYRTLGGALVLGLMMLIALGIGKDSPNLPAVISGLGSLGLFLAGKSAVEHATNKEKP